VIVLQRFKAAGNAPGSTVLDAVAVVGIVSQVDNRPGVESVLSTPVCLHKLLTTMMDAGRFVHFTVPAASQVRPLPPRRDRQALWQHHDTWVRARARAVQKERVSVRR
jgi:hypothetical protein